MQGCTRRSAAAATQRDKVITWAAMVATALGCSDLSYAKDELIDTGGSGTFSNKLPSAPVMNNDGEVAYRKNFGIVIIGGATRTIRRSTPNEVPVSVKSIVGNNQDAPSGVGKFSTFSDDGQQSIGLRINDIGQAGNPGTVMFHSSLSGLGVTSANNIGIYTAVESTTGQIFLGEVARKGDAYNDAGDRYVIFQAMGIDRIGEPAYLASVDRDEFGAPNESVIFRKQGAVLEVVDSGDAAPSSAGVFESFGLVQGKYQIVTNNKTSQLNSEKIGFYATLTDIVSIADYGVYRGSQQSQIVRMAQGGQSKFGGTISALGHPDINNNGWVAYKANIFIGPNNSKEGILAGDESGSGIATLGLAFTGDDIPSDDFVYTGFNNEPDVNNNNHVAFQAGFNGPDHRDQGIYRGSTGGFVVKVAEKGDHPDIPGLDNRAFVDVFGEFTLNDSNQVAFVADLDDGSGGASEGIYVGTGGNFKPYEVTRVGRMIDGKTVSDLEVNLGVDVGGSTGFNNEGQVAYLAKFTDGTQRIYRHTPTLKISVINSDTLEAIWATASNWNLGIVPDGQGIDYDVVVGDGAFRTLGGKVIGPESSTSIGGLTVGYPTIPNHPNPTVNLLLSDAHTDGDLQGSAAADHRDAPLIIVGGDVDILPTGQLSIQGDHGETELPAVQIAGDAMNRGRIVLSDDGKLGGHGLLTNFGVLLGDGTVCPALHNERGGQVVVNKGQRLAFVHTDTNHLNEGMITVEEGGRLFVGGQFTMLADGSAFLGDMAVASFENLTTHGSITGPGMLNVLGNLGGTGGFGDGLVNVAGQLMPANGQVGSMSFGGDLTFEPGAALEISYGGPNAITAGVSSSMASNPLLIHDTVEVAGLATLNGTLELQIKRRLIRDLQYGDMFEIMTFDSRDGVFDMVEGALFVDENLVLAPVYNDTSLVLVVTAPGDVNVDGVVGFADFALMQNGFNQQGIYEDGDVNGDGIVSFADFSLLQNNFDQVFWTPDAPAFEFMAASTTTPEPGTLVVLTMVSSGLLLGRRRGC